MSEIRTLTDSAYSGLMLKGYTETSRKEMKYNAGQGDYIVLQKNAGICARISRAVGSVFVCPFAGIGECVIGNGIWDRFRRHFCIPVTQGVFQEEGFVLDAENTTALYDEDFQKLVKVKFNGDGVTALANRERDNWIKSKTCPSHFYVGVKGPSSKFSYIVFIPDKQSEKAIAYAASNEEGQPCNDEQLSQLAELLCRGYKEGINEIRVIAEDLMPQESVAYLYDLRVGVARLPLFPAERTIETVHRPIQVTSPEEFEMMDE